VILGPLSTYEYPRATGVHQPFAEFRTKLDLYANIRSGKVAPGRRAHRQTRRSGDLPRKTPKGFTLTGTCTRAAANSCLPRTWRSRCAASPRSAASASRAAPSSCDDSPQESRRHTQGQCLQNLGRFVPGGRGAQVAKEFPAVNSRRSSWTPWPPSSCATRCASDVIVAENMYGDILSDEASELSGAWPRGSNQRRG